MSTTPRRDDASLISEEAAMERNLVQDPAGEEENRRLKLTGLNNQEMHNDRAYTRGERTEGLSRIHISMHQAAIRGDWQAAEIILEGHPHLVRDVITERGDRALHVAAAVNQMKFIEKLIEMMTPEDLLLENTSGYTAFVFAAVTGRVDIAALMARKNPNLVNTHSRYDAVTPIYFAALHGNTDMVSYLYALSIPELWPTEKWIDLLLVTIHNNMYDVALKLSINYRSLPIQTSRQVGFALRLLAEHDMSDISARREAILKTLVRMFAALPYFSWLKRICEKPLMGKKAKLLAEKLLAEIQTQEQAIVLDELSILHEAAKAGNAEFITMITRVHPDLIWTTDNSGRTIFHTAVLYRQESVLSLIHQLGAMQTFITMRLDKENKNILHLAAELAAPSRLKIVAGAALQMQRERMWFKEVEKTVRPLYLKMENSDMEKPRELFSMSHKKLLEDGETWMKETANSCMLTATLIATVVFAAAITIPGGNNGDKGSPVLLNRTLFRVFVASDVAAMFFSTFSIIMFLSILTSHFEEDDFLVSLPNKLIFGLTALFLSIVSTMSAFTSTCFLLFTDQMPVRVSILVATIACYSLNVLFGYMHFKIGVQTFRSTYLSSSLFRSSKHKLFY